MILILSNLYNDSAVNNTLIITNFSFPNDFRRGILEEDEYGSKKNTEEFLKINENLGNVEGIITANAGIINRFKDKTKIVGDYKLNIFNSHSLKFYNKQ